jgi:signal transduction histidine kinase
LDKWGFKSLGDTMPDEKELLELKKKVIEATAKAEAMKLVQEVSAGAAHNFNNLLQIILGSASMIEMTDDLAEAKRYAKNIEEAARKGTKTTQRLSDYARAVVTESTPMRVDVSKLINECIEDTRVFWYSRATRAGASIHMTYEVEPNLSIMGYKSELSEVVINLIKNSCEAMPEGGVIHVSAKSGLGSILIKISDNGTGIPRNILPKIFSPFFTTKGSEGTGMGLATCRQIIEKHDGSISVSSSPGHTVFTIALPYAS